MSNPLIAIACVAYVFSAPALVKFLVLDRSDARKPSPSKKTAVSTTDEV